MSAYSILSPSWRLYRLYPLITLFLALCIDFSFSHYSCLIFCTLFYWSLYRPLFVPLLFLFLLGITYDIFHGNLLGQSSFIFISLFTLTVYIRRNLTASSFPLVWGIFGLILTIIIFINWLLYSLSALSLLPYTDFLIQFFITLLIYPWVSFFLDKLTP